MSNKTVKLPTKIYTINMFCRTQAALQTVCSLLQKADVMDT